MRRNASRNRTRLHESSQLHIVQIISILQYDWKNIKLLSMKLRLNKETKHRAVIRKLVLTGKRNYAWTRKSRGNETKFSLPQRPPLRERARHKRNCIPLRKCGVNRDTKDMKISFSDINAIMKIMVKPTYSHHNDIIQAQFG